MSMRQRVGRQEIELFLTEVGRTRQAGRLYLLLVRQGCVVLNELDQLYQDVLTKIGHPPYDRLFPNLSSQQFSQPYQSMRRVL